MNPNKTIKPNNESRARLARTARSGRALEELKRVGDASTNFLRVTEKPSVFQNSLRTVKSSGLTRLHSEILSAQGDLDQLNKATFDFTRDRALKEGDTAFVKPTMYHNISGTEYWKHYADINLLDQELIVKHDNTLPLIPCTVIVTTPDAVDALTERLYWIFREEFDKDCYREQPNLEECGDCIECLYEDMIGFIRNHLPNIFITSIHLSKKFANFFFNLIGNTIKFKLSFESHFKSSPKEAKIWNHFTTSLRSVSKFNEIGLSDMFTSVDYSVPNYYHWNYFPTSIEPVIYSKFPMSSFYKEIQRCYQRKEFLAEDNLFDQDCEVIQEFITDEIIDCWKGLTSSKEGDDTRPEFEVMAQHPTYPVSLEYRDLFMGILPSCVNLKPADRDHNERIQYKKNVFKVLEWEQQSTNKQREVDIDARKEWAEKRKKGRAQRYQAKFYN